MSIGTSESPARRERILRAALATFVRHGYRKTSMDDVAHAAAISRPGLYLHFSSKQTLFQAAVEHEFATSLARVEQLLEAPDEPQNARIAAAFDWWLGRYIEPSAADVGLLLADGDDDLAELFVTYAAKFDSCIARTIARRPGAVRSGAPPATVAATLHATATGWKHVAGRRESPMTRAEFRSRMDEAVDLMLTA